MFWIFDVFSIKLFVKGKVFGKVGIWFWKNVGLGFKIFREVIEGMIVFFFVGDLCNFLSLLNLFCYISF